MTPDGWMSDDITRAGLIWAFAGALLAAGAGIALGLLRGPRWGLAAGLLLWGAGHAGVAALALAYVYADSTDLVAPASACDVMAGSDGAPRHQLRFPLPAGDGRVRMAVLPSAAGPCPAAPAEAADGVLLRVRRDALTADGARVRAERLADQPAAGAPLWAAFAAFGLLSGAAMRRLALRQEPVPRRPPAAWRGTIGTLLGQLGLLVFAAALVVPWWLDGSTERALQFGFRAAGTAFGLWTVAGWTRGAHDGHGGTVLLGIGAVLFGFAELLRRT